MGSTRAGAWGASAGRGADLLASAAALRWARPDLTAALADHVLETAAIAGDQEGWLTAAGWAVHARSATGDGRETASDVIGSLSRWGRDPLDHPAARRLRIELALVAVGAGEAATARGLLGPVAVDETEPELRADLHTAFARCAVEDAPERVAEALRNAAAAWSMVAGPESEVGAASVTLISAVVERRGRRPDAAVEHAAEGLTRLERGRGEGPSGTPSGHLAAALAAEWISALLDSGRADEARDGCTPLMPRLAEPARASRQLALLRLTVARAVATGGSAGSSIGLLEQAAQDAAASDAPDLESVCRTALGALQEQMGPPDKALETIRLGVAAERRDRSRIARFRSALAELPADALRAAPPAAPSRPDRSASSFRAAHGSAMQQAAGASGYDWESFLREADGTGRPTTSRARSAPEEPGTGRRRRDEYGDDIGTDYRADYRADNGAEHRGDQVDEPSSRRSAEPVRGEQPFGTAAADSPIGDGPFGSLRSGEAGRHEELGVGRRIVANGHRALGDSRILGDTGDVGDRQERRSAEPGRNGRRRSRYEEPVNGAGETGGWHLAGDPRDEDRPGSRRRQDGGGSRSTERPGAGATDGGADRWPLADPPEPQERGADSRGGRRHRADSSPSMRGADEPAGREPPPPTDVLPTTPANGADDPEGWLRAALADLDRIWGTAGPGTTTPRQPEGGPANTRAAERAHTGAAHTGAADAGAADVGAAGVGADRRWAVVIDVARDGRRFAGRRAGAVVRAAAQRLAERLPDGARLRFRDSDALSISIPGWDLDTATEWMHRTLPVLLSGFDAGEDLPSAQLRAAVHDADGPVGAQILRSLERSPGRRHGADGLDAERRGRERSPTGRPDPDDRSPDSRSSDSGRSGRRHGSDRDSEPAGRSWEGNSGSGRGEEPDARSGHHAGDGGGRRRRHDADSPSTDRTPGRTAERGEAGQTDPGRAGRGGADTSAAGGVSPESTEGLGIADLLAGALAAYRSI